MKKSLSTKIWNYPLGIWFALFALIIIFIAWIMQAFSLFNWEEAVKLGIQNNRFDAGEIEHANAVKERGEAIADLIWVLPMTVIAFIGVLKKSFIGFTASMMTFAICVYFPLFYIFQLWGSNNFDTALGAILLWGFPSLLGIIGLWTNRRTFNI
jgi:hypothetical protein